MVAALLPEDLWRRILEFGIETESLSYKDLCRFSITCTRFRILSSEDSLWSTLLLHDFAHNKHDPFCFQFSKSVYQTRFERDKARKLAANRRALLRMEGQVAEHTRRVGALELQLEEESQKLKDTFSELSNLRNVRRSSVAMNVWQPEIIRSSQRQLVEQCVVPVESRMSALEMEHRLCKKQIAGFDKAYTNEKRRLEAAKEVVMSMKYHPLRDYESTSSRVDESRIKRKKIKRSINMRAYGPQPCKTGTVARYPALMSLSKLIIQSPHSWIAQLWHLWTSEK